MLSFDLCGFAIREEEKILKNWVKWTGIFMVVIVTVGGYTYWKLNPHNHFKKMEHPVLAEPNKPTMDHHLNQTGISVTESTAPSMQNDPSTFNVLILGIDAREEDSSRTDIIMVAHVDPLAKKVNIVSIPRDTRVNLPGIGKTKINHAHFLGNLKGGNNAGTEASIQAVSDLLNIPINYYFKTNFEGFAHFVNSIGGIEIDLPKEVKLDHRLKGRSVMSLPAGKQTLDGDQTLDFVRERYSMPNGDFDRQTYQVMVLRLIAEKMTKVNYLPKLPGLLNQVKQDFVDTNFKDSDLISLAWLFKNFNGNNIKNYQLPGHSEYALDPLLKLKLYYWIPNDKDVQDIADKYLLSYNKKDN
jgi:LCP family protein required for cell wall assembly